MLYPFIPTANKITSEHLAKLIEKRNLNNSRMAKILGVEGWAVGAWLAGKREISEKYKEKIYELLMLPETSDLLIAPAAHHLAKRIREIEEEADRPKIITALMEIIKVTGYRLADFSFNKIESAEIDVIESFLTAYDDYSIAQLNQSITSLLAKRVLLASLSSQEYAMECIERSQNDKFNKELLLELDSGMLYAHYSLTLDIADEVYKRREAIEEEFSSKYSHEDYRYHKDIFHGETGECQLNDDDLNTALKPIREKHEEDTYKTASMIFQYTAFQEDENNMMWVDDNSFSVTYMILLENTKFKDSLRMVMNRQIINN